MAGTISLMTSAVTKRRGLVGNFYVAPASAQGGIGNDTNNGTSRATPFATIQKASTVVSAGQTVVVLAGSYPGRGFRITSSGTSGNPITYISDVQWGAKIIGIQNTTCLETFSHAQWSIGGNWNVIDGFEVDGTLANNGADTSWQLGFYNNGQNNIIRYCHVHHQVSLLAQYNALETSATGGAGIEHDYFSGGINGQTFACLMHDVGVGRTSEHTHCHYMSTSGKVMNCISYGSSADGMTSWHGANAIDYINNTIYDAGSSGILLGGGDAGMVTGGCQNCHVYNNIIHTVPNAMTENGTVANNLFTNNTCFNISSTVNHTINATVTGTVTTDPLLVNPAGADFHLQAGSPAKGTGTTNGGLFPATDFDKVTRPSPPSRGAYE